MRPPTLALLALLAPHVAPQGSCFEGARSLNVPAPSPFSADGLSTVLVLRVGNDESSLVPGSASSLFLDEINVTSRFVRSSIALPTTGATVGGNLACALSTGMYANASFSPWGNTGFFADYCNNETAFWGQMPPSQGGALCDAQGTHSPSAHYNASWNVDPIGSGHGDGAYPLWFWDREGLPSLSYDGRMVSFPCYVAASDEGVALKRGSWFGAFTPDDTSTYDDKTIAVVNAGGSVDTATHLPGSDFFLGPLAPNEPQYMVSAVTTGEFSFLNPKPFFFVGGAANNGEGVMYIDDDALSPSKVRGGTGWARRPSDSVSRAMAGAAICAATTSQHPHPPLPLLPTLCPPL